MNRFLTIFLASLIYYHFPAFGQPTSGFAGNDPQMILKRQLMERAIAMTDSGRLDRSLSCLDSILVGNPSDLDALFYKARVLGWQGDSSAAIELLSKIVAAFPDASKPRIKLARFLIETGSPDDAWYQIDRALAVVPRDGESLFLKGLILEKRGELDNAISMYRKAVESSMGVPTE